MPPLQALAYPLLLAAVYGLYRVGRGQSLRSPGAFEVVRIVVLVTALVLVAALQVRFVSAGQLSSPVALGAGVLSLAAVAGLVGLHVFELTQARRRRPVAA